MAPFFFFDFTFDKSNPPAQVPIPRPKQKERQTKTDNLCPYRIPTIDEIVKDIESASCSTDKRKFVSDLFECGAIAVSNMVDLSQRKMREKRYLQIIRNYKHPEQSMLAKIFAKVYALLASVVYDNGKFNDNLGELFMCCNLGNKNTGQFFTPYHISEFMARATLEESLIKEKAEKDGILTISDPCCGGGRFADSCFRRPQKPRHQLCPKLFYRLRRHRHPLHTYDLSPTFTCRRTCHCKTSERINAGVLGSLVYACLFIPIPEIC